MPVYTYHCENCGHEFDKYQSFSEDALTKCPSCSKSALHKVYQAALVVFKGSGYYVTDTRSTNSTLTPASSKSNGSSSTSDGKEATTAKNHKPAASSTGKEKKS